MVVAYTATAFERSCAVTTICFVKPPAVATSSAESAASTKVSVGGPWRSPSGGLRRNIPIGYTNAPNRNGRGSLHHRPPPLPLPPRPCPPARPFRCSVLQGLSAFPMGKFSADPSLCQLDLGKSHTLHFGLCHFGNKLSKIHACDAPFQATQQRSVGVSAQPVGQKLNFVSSPEADAVLGQANNLSRGMSIIAHKHAQDFLIP